MSIKSKSTLRQKKRARDGKPVERIPEETLGEEDETNLSESEGDEESGTSSAENDEMNLEDISSASEADVEEGEEDDAEETKQEQSGNSDEEEFPMKKKSKNSKHDDGSSGFSSAVTAILSSHLKAYNRNDPIMTRNKKVLKQNESDKLEQQAKKALLVEKKKLLNKARKKEIIPAVTDDIKSGEEIRKVLEKETKLRKIARKGAVKLFNAILSTQVKTEKEVKDTLGDVKNKQEREELITEVSKEKFFDMVKAAAEEE